MHFFCIQKKHRKLKEHMFWNIYIYHINTQKAKQVSFDKCIPKHYRNIIPKGVPLLLIRLSSY